MSPSAFRMHDVKTIPITPSTIITKPTRRAEPRLRRVRSVSCQQTTPRSTQHTGQRQKHQNMLCCCFWTRGIYVICLPSSESLLCGSLKPSASPSLLGHSFASNARWGL